MVNQANGTTFPDVTCPFCGLCCDDLVVQVEGAHIEVRDHGCPISDARFAQAPGEDSTMVDGLPVTREHAFGQAAEMLRGARQPLFAGLGTDVEGARAIIGLADRLGGALDHMHSDALMRNLLVLQDSGWMTTTLTEVRNRADLLVVFGTSIPQRLPRFYERFVNNSESMFDLDLAAREVIVIGPGAELHVPQGVRNGSVVDCPVEKFGELAGALRCVLHERALDARAVAGIELERIRALAQRMQQARYGVIAWAAAEMAYPHAELAVQSLCRLVEDLNRRTRFSGLPLGGQDGDLTVNQVLGWQTGGGLRTSFGSGHPTYDPHLYRAARMLETREADVLVWVSALDAARTPPAGAPPAIVLGRSGMHCPTTPRVFIPVATPGIDHAGHAFRCDTVVALPLRKLREAGLAPVSEVMAAIEAQL